MLSLLRAVGVHEDLSVSVNGCKDFLFPPDDLSLTRSGQTDRFGTVTGTATRDAGQFANVRIRLRSPIPATPDAIAELEKTKGYRELLGRVTGSSAAVQEAAAQFPARWVPMTLSHKTLGLEPEECELVEQMTRDVLPRLGVRVVEKSIMCIPRQVSLIAPQIKVEALIKTPLDEGSAQESPESAPSTVESEESEDAANSDAEAETEVAPEDEDEDETEPTR